jgi:threonine/homoserine/homoserine lactone efflux protein
LDLIDEQFGAFLAVTLLLIVTPGPDTALVTRNALRDGTRAASLTALGVGAGTLAWATASALGLAVLLERSLVAFTVIKLAGAAYLIGLGLRSLFEGAGAGDVAAAATPLRQPQQRDRFAGFKQGLLSNVLNPKVGVFFVAVFPQFVGPTDDSARIVSLVVAYEAMLLLWLTLIGFLVERVGRSRAGAHVRAAVHRLTGAVLIGLGLRLALYRR